MEGVDYGDSSGIIAAGFVTRAWNEITVQIDKGNAAVKTMENTWVGADRDDFVDFQTKYTAAVNRFIDAFKDMGKDLGVADDVATEMVSTNRKEVANIYNDL